MAGSKSGKDEANPVCLIPARNALLCPTRKAFVFAVDKACYTYFLVYSLEYMQYYSSFESVDQILWCYHSIEKSQQYFPMVLLLFSMYSSNV